MNVLGLCSGVGGLELGVHLAVPTARTVCYVEREAYPAAILVRRMAEGILADAPVWSDLRTFDGRPWRGVVDLVTAGFPCQPVSVAGGRQGSQDERWMWPHVLRVVREVGPRFVFLENVRGLFSHGFGEVLQGLASAGFDAEWGVFSAAGVGAPHSRERVFLLGHSVIPGLEGGVGPLLEGGEPLSGHPARSCRGVVDGDLPCGSCEAPYSLGDTGFCFDCIANGWAPAGASLPLFPPGPQEGWGGVPEELWPPETCLRGVADGTPHRVDRLRACGNGVVPLAAAVAFRTLLSRIPGGSR